MSDSARSRQCCNVFSSLDLTQCCKRGQIPTRATCMLRAKYFFASASKDCREEFLQCCFNFTGEKGRIVYISILSVRTLFNPQQNKYRHWSEMPSFSVMCFIAHANWSGLAKEVPTFFHTFLLSCIPGQFSLTINNFSSNLTLCSDVSDAISNAKKLSKKPRLFELLPLLVNN